jgi:hypothetical protein
MSGEEYRDHVVDRVCHGRWPSTATLTVIAFLREVRMGDATVETVVNRVLLRQVRETREGRPHGPHVVLYGLYCVLWV